MAKISIIQQGRNLAIGRGYDAAKEAGLPDVPMWVQRLPYLFAKLASKPIVTTDEMVEQLVDDEPSLTEMTIEDIKLPYPPIVQISLAKTIVKTPLAGRDFTFKDIIQAEDYAITISGYCFNEETLVMDSTEAKYSNVAIESKEMPLDWFDKLNKLARTNASLKVDCPLFNRLGFDRMVIERFEPVLDGFYNAFAYKIQAVSDVYIELEQEATQ